MERCIHIYTTSPNTTTMGIRLLNTFLRKISTQGTYTLSLHALRGKKVVIDANIYLYRFLADKSLIEHMYLMCSILRHYNIHPLFIFDGTAPKAKKITLSKRKEKKKLAKQMYKKCQSALAHATDPMERHNLIKHMNTLQRKCIYVDATVVKRAQALLDAYGMKYIQAHGEADGLCAALVKKNMAYACFSEDTDLFAYGCPRVLKYLSLLHHTAVMYELPTICGDLSMNFEDFQTMCILAGTDYNEPKLNIFSAYTLFQTYVQTYVQTSTSNFLEWLHQRYISPQTYASVQDISRIYITQGILAQEKYKCIQNSAIDKFALQQILQSDGFIFA